MPEHYPREAFEKAYQMIDTFNPATSLGAEIEAFIPKHHPVKYVANLPPSWVPDTDGSIEPEDDDVQEGIEYISPILHNKAGVKTVVDLLNTINGVAGVNKSCAFHIHAGIFPVPLGAENQSPAPGAAFVEHPIEVIKQIIVNYDKLASFGLSFPDRFYSMRTLKEDNNYDGDHDILSVNNSDLSGRERIEADARDLEGVIQPVRYETDASDDEVDNAINSARDLAPINLKSLFHDGTIEFRAHPGDLNPCNVMAWMQCINNLIHISKGMVAQNNGIARTPSPAHMGILRQTYDTFRAASTAAIDPPPQQPDYWQQQVAGDAAQQGLAFYPPPCCALFTL